MAHMPRAKFGPPSEREMRRMRAEDMVSSTFRGSPTFKQMTRQAEKSMSAMEKEVHQGFKDAIKKAGGR